MQQQYLQELSKLIEKIRNPSQAIIFTDLDWKIRHRPRPDNSYYCQSQSFKPISNRSTKDLVNTTTHTLALGFFTT